MHVFHVDEDPPYYALVQWRPNIDIPSRKNKIGVGKPLMRLAAFPSHLQIIFAWCFSSGHFDVFEEEVNRRVERDDFSPALFAELCALFSPEGVEEVRALYESGPYSSPRA